MNLHCFYVVCVLCESSKRSRVTFNIKYSCCRINSFFSLELLLLLLFLQSYIIAVRKSSAHQMHADIVRMHSKNKANYSEAAVDTHAFAVCYVNSFLN